MHVLALLREKYSDFGPTLATEKLLERHSIRVSIETLRSWMTADVSGYHTRAVKPGFISPVISVTAWVNWSRLMVLTMTGSKAVQINAAC